MDTETLLTESERVESALLLEDRLRDRLVTLKENRERFITDAQRQLAALDAAIGELSALLNPAAQNGSEDHAETP